MTAADADGGGIYWAELLEHARNPAGCATIARDEAGTFRKINPACGDEVRLRLVKDATGLIVRVEHQTRGCAICVASASMLATEVSAHGGMTPADAFARAAEVSDRLATGRFEPTDGPLQALAPVSRFPARLACARLAWTTLADAAAASASPPSKT